MKSYILMFGIVFLSLLTNAQFDLVSQEMGVTVLHEGTDWGNGASFFDFNHDGWDDLTTANGDSTLQFFQNNGAGTLVELEINLPINDFAQVKAIVWVDYDNDGDSDLFISQYGGRLYLLNNLGNLNFTDVTAEAGISTGIYNYYGVSFGDVNKDGYLDFYISKYYNPAVNPQAEYSSVFYMNTGTGAFVDMTTASGLFQSPSPSFQSVFFDYNKDGYLDLFIIVDRVMWPNELFVNNGNGTFTEVSDLMGASVGIDSMCANLGDYDNDLDLDIYITDGVIGNVLLQNNYPNNFQNRAASAGVTVNKICWGSNWLDADNDGWQDLFVATTIGLFTDAPNIILKNNSQDGFSDMSQAWGIGTDNSPSMCNVIGDINNDGYFDYYNNNNYPSYSELWQSETGENNFVSMTFEGTISNRDAVGTEAIVYFNNTHNLRLKQFGESYLAQNSGKEIVGVGSAEIIDSIIIHWPSGLVNKYFDLLPNNQYHFIESQSGFQQNELSTMDFTICPNQEIILDGGEGESWLWNNGYDGRFLSITEPGTYQVQITDQTGIVYLTNEINITEQQPPVTVVTSFNPTCFNYSNGWVEFEYTYEENTLLYFNNEVILNSSSNLEAGIYEYALISQSGCSVSGVVELTEPEEFYADYVITEPACANDLGQIEILNVAGGTPPYFTDFFGQDPSSVPQGDYTFLILDNQGCPFVGEYQILSPESILLDLSSSPQIDDAPGLININAVGGTGNLEYFLNGESIGNSSSIEVLTGTYTITVVDENGCSLTDEIEVGFEVSVSEIENQIILYPNPASNEFTLELQSSEVSKELFVYSAQGKLVYSKKINSFKTNVDASNWSEGIYLLKIGDEQKMLIKQ